MANQYDDESTYALDEVDRGILFALQRNARQITTEKIGAEVNVSASTVRNRIQNLEEAGIIEGYVPKLNYERAGFPLRVMFVATAATDSRDEVARESLSVDGVVDVREMLTSQRNLFIEVIATDTRDLTNITHEMNRIGLEIISSEIVANHYAQPFGELKF